MDISFIQEMPHKAVSIVSHLPVSNYYLQFFFPVSLQMLIQLKYGCIPVNSTPLEFI